MNRLTVTLGFTMILLWSAMALAITADGDGIIEPGEDPEEELAKAAQNPVANMISLPFQNNTNFNFGPLEKTQNVLNIQPVLPFSLNASWNLITRTIVPIISQPPLFPGDDRENGLGDIFFTAFLSPANPGSLIWGAGPVLLLPTATDEKLGGDKWGAGPSAVALSVRGPWLFGALANHVWSFAGDGDRDGISRSLIQPFVNFNLPHGWYLVSSPVLTADWKADSSNVWTIPVGGGVGKIFRIGGLPVNTVAQAFYNVEKPDFEADWSLRLQVQFLFPR
jgi:hypothetical protein